MKKLALIALLIAGAAYGAAPIIPYQRDGIAALQAKDYARCTAIFEAALKTEPKEAIAPATGAARCSGGAGDKAKARKYLDVALSRGYKSCTALKNDALLAGVVTPHHIARCEENDARYYASTNAEILAAFVADQADRAGDWEHNIEAIMKRDAQRRGLVNIARSHNALRTADDYYRAAMIMQHGSTPAEYELARDLAQHAVDLNPAQYEARWLVAASTDRLLWNQGEPQVYGTQYKHANGNSGPWTLEPWNPDGVTDAERVAHGVATAAERRRFIEDLNAHK